MNAQKIGGFIKELRKEKNLTQKELAEKLNCTDKAVSRWETGRGIPEISLLIPISKALDVSVNELLMGERIVEEEIKEKAEQLIVETIVHTEKKIGGLKKMICSLFCLVLFILFYVTPLTAGPTDVMGVVFLIFIGTMLDSLILGLTSLKIKTKLLFTFVVVLIFVPSVFLPYFSGNTDVLFLYTPALAGFHLIFVLLGTGIRKLSLTIKESISE
ncbi:MAG: helix-turn-helix transcriptional regulator [Clostridia bacterium]|nr:helix-turn-helix transcriptional regulator [Clostridia bacterium]